MDPFVGIDFGTTNTAVGLATAAGAVELAPLAGPAGPTTTWRTVLYFEPGARTAHAGAEAIARYLAADGDGRLIQSIKSHLASASFSSTSVFGRTFTIEALVAEFVRRLREAVPVPLGRRAVVGRPVRFWGAEHAADDDRAVTRLATALDAAGFDEVAFEFEPIAAAARYAARLDHDEVVLVADFGGGTSDFTIVRVGRDTDLGDGRAVLATGGLGVGGDSFDARVIDHAVAPALGKGTTYLDEMGGEAPVPAWLYGRLRRWHHLSFLKTPETLRLLARVARGSRAPVELDRLIALVEHDLGLPLHQAVERSKIQLSSAGAGGFAIAAADLELACQLARVDFERWIAEDLGQIAAVIDDVLARAGIPASAVDRVFATGGSSLVPAVRALLEARFPGRLVGGEELTSVAAGLAARAARRFA